MGEIRVRKAGNDVVVAYISGSGKQRRYEAHQVIPDGDRKAIHAQIADTLEVIRAAKATVGSLGDVQGASDGA